MTFKTINGYDVSVNTRKYREGEFIISISIHLQENVSTTYMLQLDTQEMKEFVNETNTILNGKEGARDV